jgi:hypothetical protein
LAVNDVGATIKLRDCVNIGDNGVIPLTLYLTPPITELMNHLYDHCEVRVTHDGNVSDGINVNEEDDEREMYDGPLIVNNGNGTDTFVTTRDDMNEVAPKKLVTDTLNV